MDEVRRLAGELHLPILAIPEIEKALEKYEQAIETEMYAFFDRCKAERQAARDIELAKDPKAHFSQIVLRCHKQNGYRRLEWVKFVRVKGQKGARMFRISNKGTSYHMSKIISGAHPSEISLIRSHEEQAFKLRELNKEFLHLQKLVKRQRKSSEGVAALASDPMVLAAKP